MKFIGIGQRFVQQPVFQKGLKLELSEIGTIVNNEDLTMNYLALATTGIVSGEINVARIHGGHHGYHHILIKPNDFIADQDGENPTVLYDDSTRGVKSVGAGSDMYAHVAIPFGMKATVTTIFGSDTSTVRILKKFITASTAPTSLGTGQVGTQINHTDLAAPVGSDVDGGSAYVLEVVVEPADTDTRIYGGIVTIA
tara:strand:+ start:154 stop:744 length:591 start_codon:yes stop_codon:yes gene_type:complete